jgi:hypothetical protein
LNRRALRRFPLRTRRPPRSPDPARVAPCTTRASRTPRRCRPSSCASRSGLDIRCVLHDLLHRILLFTAVGAVVAPTCPAKGNMTHGRAPQRWLRQRPRSRPD